jgi:hypothetical protein
LRLRGAFLRWLGRRQAELSLWCHVQAFPALAVWAGLNCVAAMILIQRAIKESALKLPGGQLGLMATGAAVLALVARALLARFEERRPAAWMRALAAGAAAGPILALLLGTSRRVSWGNIAFTGFLAMGVALATWLWSREFIERLVAAFLTTPRKDSGITRLDAFELSAASERHSPPTIGEATGDSEPTLWMRRTAVPGGDDRLEGAVFVDFAAGQSVATVHVAFCPAFARAPQFVCEVRNAPEARVKGTAVYPYGCRLELKRGDPRTGTARIEVRFSASQWNQSTRAA